MITAQTLEENAVCTFLGNPIYSLTLCETAQIGAIILIVATAITIGLIVAVFLFRNELRTLFKRWQAKTPN